MGIKTVSCSIKGTSPLLMHAYPLQQIEAIEKRTIEEQAEYSAYRDPDTGFLFFPGVNIQRAIVSGATYSKGKNRSSLQKPVAACVLINPERVSFGVKTYDIDTRPVVIPATKGRVLRHRPRLNNWSLTFEIEFDDNLLTEEQLRRVVDDTGLRVGFGDFRPEKKGPFGRYMVVEWK